jgi:hypothetical protein
MKGQLTIFDLLETGIENNPVTENCVRSHFSADYIKWVETTKEQLALADELLAEAERLNAKNKGKKKVNIRAAIKNITQKLKGDRI